MIRFTFLIWLIFAYSNSLAQNAAHYVDSIRKRYHIPELSYAVVSSDSVLEIKALGVRKIHSGLSASLSDRYRIGSNTKAITGFIAAMLVHEGKLSWDTIFFDLFPEMKLRSRKEYYNATLLDLLTFRTKLKKYTYTDTKPTRNQFHGNEAAQRTQFISWFLSQPPVQSHDKLCFTNVGYVAVGLMLGRASGISYKQLVNDLGEHLGINFGFGQPNATSALQTWGHNSTLTPEPPSINYKLNWLLAAGNINVTLPDYIKFIQLQLKGLHGRSDLLSEEDFNFLHYGLPVFSIGWFHELDENNNPFSYNIGNPGSFLSMVYVFKNANKAIIIFSNAQTDDAERGMNNVLSELKKTYKL